MDPTEEWFFPRVGNRIRNRTVLAALTNKQSNDDGTLSDEEINFLLRRGQGGFGITPILLSSWMHFMNAEVNVNTGGDPTFETLIALEQALIKTDDIGGPELSDENVSNYLDYFADERSKITIRDLLDMSSGLDFPSHEHEKMFFQSDHLKYAKTVGVEKEAGPVSYTHLTLPTKA